MTAIASRVARSALARRPLPAAQRGLRTTRVVRQTEPGAPKPKEPATSGDGNKYLAGGALAAAVGFYWFYRGGKPPNAVLDAPGEGSGMMSTGK
ncbi:hypothetical protein FALBO_4961 [Fusarium albosuccineum]|uniref:Uncharacterized protein n=1 Tax=Fusarium albosuccineum TaxID=1237068 RepID=A0A8H4LHC2_9HYPO|nr:hypothetical protein FALBO_4961 [Fusarium albosuccineum]